MCTNEELKIRFEAYCSITDRIAKLEKEKKELSDFIVNEIDSRSDNEKLIAGYNVIMERLTENATKEGKQVLKDAFPDNTDQYISVSLSRFPNKRNIQKILNQ